MTRGSIYWPFKIIPAVSPVVFFSGEVPSNQQNTIVLGIYPTFFLRIRDICEGYALRHTSA